ncbi:ABC transporter ATP-binding protein [Microlunatus parietis]|uniref:Iron complex transport system ATP-binding protein n=1 Tax=Microlunatus parietis TaxID=682979 RepID=A0A7Y9I3B2_9ACTN|nr:ABC transporter ATP-binding protein [Microlunatus parietis]NYE69461.1 iron complex transport system ATP-binding protein [Microlunatus parietis]
MIEATGLSYAYDGIPALADVDLEAGPGAIVGLIGPNGSGKSTLLRLLYRALTPQSGSVIIDGVPVQALGSRELPRRVAVVAQEPPAEISLTVAELVLLGRSPHRSSLQAYTGHDHRVAAAALHRVGMREFADRGVGTLSGGEKQRALIARAIAQEADHLLLDEPTNHLDIHYQHEVLRLVRAMGVATVIVLHDLNLAARYCDALVLLDHGRVVASGTVRDVLRPEILGPVYRVGVRVIDDDGCPQLIFRPDLEEPGPGAETGPGSPLLSSDHPLSPSLEGFDGPR